MRELLFRVPRVPSLTRNSKTVSNSENLKCRGLQRFFAFPFLAFLKLCRNSKKPFKISNIPSLPRVPIYYVYSRVRRNSTITSDCCVVIFNQAAWSLTHSLSASSIRVCQPSPVDLKYSTTSGLYLTDSKTLLLSDLGLPRWICSLAALAYSSFDTTLPPIWKVALSKNSSVSSGISSYSSWVMTWASNLLQSLCVFFDFSLIGFSHRNNVSGFTALRPNDYHHAAIQKAESNNPAFAVVLPCILKIHRSPGKYLAGFIEINAAIFKCLVSLVRIIGDFHCVYCSYIKHRVKPDKSASASINNNSLIYLSAGQCQCLYTKALIINSLLLISNYKQILFTYMKL